MEVTKLLEAIPDEVEEYLSDCLLNGLLLAEKAANVSAMEVYPLDRETFLRVALWLEVPEKICCFHAERIHFDGAYTYTGPMLFFCDPDKVDAEKLRDLFHITGTAVLLDDVLAEAARKAN